MSAAMEVALRALLLQILPILALGFDPAPAPGAAKLPWGLDLKKCRARDDFPFASAAWASDVSVRAIPPSGGKNGAALRFTGLPAAVEAALAGLTADCLVRKEVQAEVVVYVRKEVADGLKLDGPKQGTRVLLSKGM